MQIGSTFSHPHLTWLGHDPISALKEYKSLGFSWIRLGAYWSEIEKTQGSFDFQELDRIIKICEDLDLKIVLTVGMKAPRYPEYYIPTWLKSDFRRFTSFSLIHDMLLNSVTQFIEKTVMHYKNKRGIKVWQVENEPLDPSGQKWWRISPEFLEKEVELVRKLDPQRKIMVTLWGNELTKRKIYQHAMHMADIVGIDLYLRHPMLFFFNFMNKYIGPMDSTEKILKIKKEIEDAGKEFWIAELQAEPWETDGAITKKENPPSFSFHHAESNIEYGESLHPSVLFLWGFEWWYHKKKTGDTRYWDEIQRNIKH